MRLLLVKDANVELSLRELQGTDGSTRLQSELAASGQLSVLVSSCVLTLASKCVSNSSPVPLIIPNLESRKRKQF
jgi:hypothetical protein